MDHIRTEFITEAIKKNQVVRFAKFGDGEYACCLGQQGQNCDGDVYFPELSRALNEAFIILAQTPNTYLGEWREQVPHEFYANLFSTRTGKDLGSSFDCLARGTPSRAYQFHFFKEVDYYAGLLPQNWLATTPGR